MEKNGQKRFTNAVEMHDGNTKLCNLQLDNAKIQAF